MPHAGLMEEKSMPLEDGLLLRAKLHIRGGKRRLRPGKISAGLVTLYDAFCAALELQTVLASSKQKLLINEDENLNDDKTVYEILVRSKIVDGSFNFNEFDEIVNRALVEEIREFDYKPLVEKFERLMVELGIMPFGEDSLPPEDPSTS